MHADSHGGKRLAPGEFGGDSKEESDGKAELVMEALGAVKEPSLHEAFH